MSELVYIIVLVLSSAATLVLVSIGLSVIFGVLGVVNFAQGEFLTIGAFTTISCQKYGLNLWLSMIVGALAVAVIAGVIERLVIRRLYGRLENTMLATWGVSIILVQILLDIYGTSTPGVAQPFGVFRVGPFGVPVYSVFLIVVTLLVLSLVYLLFKKTSYGIIARAVVQDSTTAEALGINSSRVYTTTFVLGGFLAGLGGALIAPTVAVTANLGQAYLGQAFMMVVLGGPGVVSGTAMASLLLGGTAQVISFWGSAVFGVLVLFAVAIVLLRFLPTGVTGRLGLTL